LQDILDLLTVGIELLQANDLLKELQARQHKQYQEIDRPNAYSRHAYRLSDAAENLRREIPFLKKSLYFTWRAASTNLKYLVAALAALGKTNWRRRPGAGVRQGGGDRRALGDRFSHVDLLVLVDFGMKKLGPSAAEDLLEIFVRRYETASTLITTNRPTQDRGQFLSDIPTGPPPVSNEYFGAGTGSSPTIQILDPKEIGTRTHAFPHYPSMSHDALDCGQGVNAIGESVSWREFLEQPDPQLNGGPALRI
jgi:hypothetical protein